MSTTWEDGTPKSTGNAFEWDTGEPTVFALDPHFTAKGVAGLSRSQIAAHGRENAENNGNDVSTLSGIGRLVIEKTNTKSFHVYSRAKASK